MILLIKRGRNRSLRFSYNQQLSTLGGSQQPDGCWLSGPCADTGRGALGKHSALWCCQDKLEPPSQEKQSHEHSRTGRRGLDTELPPAGSGTGAVDRHSPVARVTSLGPRLDLPFRRSFCPQRGGCIWDARPRDSGCDLSISHDTEKVTFNRRTSEST